jgi:F-type H+-transporting ATPase subunit delta
MSADARTIAARYARALFDLAREQDALDVVHKDLEDLAALLDSSKEFGALVLQPHWPEKRVESCLTSLLEGKAQALTLQFLRFLVRRKRLHVLPEVIPLFDAMHDRHLGQQKVDVVSAVPLSATQRDLLSARLKKRIGLRVEAHYREDARLIGGFRARVGDTIYDYSIATMLETFKQKLLNA